MDIPCVVGLDHTVASLYIRQKFAISDNLASSIISRLMQSGITKEIVILSTCNRTELYCVTSDIDFVVDALCDMVNVCPRSFTQYSYKHSGADAVKHLFYVICGLKSMVFGETEIVAQVKYAYDLARSHGSVSMHLNNIFQMALAVNKEVRSSTKINNISTSLAKAVKLCVDNHISSLDNKCTDKQKILFIGAGGMVSQIAKYFSSTSMQVGIVNRSYANAFHLSKLLGCSDVTVHEFINIQDILPNYSIIVSCCDLDDKQHLVVSDTLKCLASKQDHALIIDLSLPLIFDISKMHQHNNITFLSVDDMAHIVDVGESSRKLSALGADKIIESKLLEYTQWLNKRDIIPTIQALQDKIGKLKSDALVDARQQLENGIAAHTVLEDMINKLANKLLHNPIAALCSIGSNNIEMLNLISDLYELNTTCKSS